MRSFCQLPRLDARILLEPMKNSVILGTICSHILVLLHTCSHSLVSIGEWHTQLNKNNLRLVNYSSLFLNHTTSITSPCILILMIDISQHPFTLSNQTAVYTPIPHKYYLSLPHIQRMFFPGGSLGKNLPANGGDMGLIPGLGRSPEGGNGNPSQYLCLGNPWTEEPGRLLSMRSQSQPGLSDWVHTHIKRTRVFKDVYYVC